MRRSVVSDDLPAKTNEDGMQPTNFSLECNCEFLKEWNANLWWDSYKQQANESRNNYKKPHEAVPLSEYGGRTGNEEVAPEVVQSQRRETILDRDISQIAST